MKKEKKAVKRGTRTPNKRWSKEESEFMVNFLAKQATMGQKIHKTFKKPALVAAVAAVNEKFNQNFTVEKLENHLASIKAKWKDIMVCKGLSGAGWDEKEKMIIFDQPTYDTYIAAHEKRKHYINVPIPNYDNMLLVYGEDFATGSFKKSIYEFFGQDDTDTIDLCEDDDMNENSPKVYNSGLDFKPISQALLKATKKSKQALPKKGKMDIFQETCKELVGSLEEVAKAFQTSLPEDWRKELGRVVMSQVGFEEDDLDLAFENLAKDENKAMTFLAKPPSRQMKQIGDLIGKLK